MTRAEFEEKEFEQAANLELGDGGGFLMSPGQVLEKIVSYDAVAAPTANHVVWQLLEHPRPAGVRLLPSLWAEGGRPPAQRLPEHPISIMLQYKRPDFLSGPRAAQWTYWRTPYYRFSRSESQHKVLRRLDRSLEGAAVVRYAAPAFWQFTDLEVAVVTRQVLQRTGFVRPIDLKHHRTWTYVGPGVEGRANPSGRRLLFESFDQLTELLIPPDSARLPEQLDAPIDRLASHLAEVAATCRAREPVLRRGIDSWVRSLEQRGLTLTSESVTRIGHLATISTLASRIGATWLVADALDPPRLPG